MRRVRNQGAARCREYALGQLGALAIVVLSLCGAAAASSSPCRRVVIENQVEAGREWSTPIGRGWVFRLVPIAHTQDAYSGWDLVVDRSQPAGFPDALLLATMPYNSINEREIGTTFGLRAQDAIGWNPRSFRFITDQADLREGQRLYRSLTPAAGHQNQGVMQSLLKLQERASWGEFRILDARLVPGTGDPAPYAQAWAMASARTPHQILPAVPSSARGELRWLRFSLTLWLPAQWTLPGTLRAVRSNCPE